MASKRVKLAACGAQTSFGTVQCLVACSSENTISAIELQQRFLAQRFSVRPDHARLIAELAFQARRAA